MSSLRLASVAESPLNKENDDIATEEGRQELIFISGKPGLGKTALADSLRNLVTKDGGFFLTGKFSDTFMEPYAVFVQAFTEFVDLVEVQHPRKIRRLRTSIFTACGNDIGLLVELVPSLRRILGDDGRSQEDAWNTESEATNINSRSPEALSRFHNSICSFVKAVCRFMPLVLFLADLQWADSASLALIQVLATQADGAPLVIVATFRHESSDRGPRQRTSHLDEAIGYLEAQTTKVKVTKILLVSLSRSVVNELLADILSSSKQQTEELSGLFHQQTDGNPMHILQLLQVLVDQNVIKCEHGSWIWDLRVVKEHMGSGYGGEDLVFTIAKKMKETLTESAVATLKVAACLGAEVDDSALQIVFGTKTILPDLELAHQEGFLVFDSQAGGYRFSHNSTLSAAIALIPEERRDAFFLDVGRKLWTGSTQAALESNVFLVTELLHKGSSFIMRVGERYGVAGLHLLAGERAAALYNFPDSALFLRRGIDLLDEKCWTIDYDLSFRLYVTSAEVELQNNNYGLVGEHLKTLFENVNSHWDKARLNLISITSLAMQGEIISGAEVGRQVLKDLNEPLPKKPGLISLVKEILLTKWALRGRSSADLVRLPWMTDQKRAITSEALVKLFPFFFALRSPCASIVGMRTVRYSLRYGLFQGSSLGFASCAVVLCHIGEFDSAEKLAEVAMRLQENEATNLNLPAVICMVTLATVRKPIQDSLEPLKSAARLALETGSYFTFSSLIGVQMALSWLAGTRLGVLESEYRHYSQILSKHVSQFALELLRPNGQLIDCLLGLAEDRTILSGDKFDLEEEPTETSIAFVCANQYRLAIVFGMDKKALEMVDMYLRLPKPKKLVLPTLEAHFIGSLACLSLAPKASSKGDYNKLLSKAHALSMLLLKWSDLAPHFAKHKWLLIDAETDAASPPSADDDTSTVLAKYDEAILSAEEQNKLIAGIACERAAAYAKRSSLLELYDEYIIKAIANYAEHDAAAKVAQLEEMRSELKEQESSSTQETEVFP